MTIAALSQASKGYLEFGKTNKWWYCLTVNVPCFDELLEGGWSTVTEQQDAPIPLCRLVFPVEIIADFIVRENSGGLYLIRKNINLQPSRRLDTILCMWRKVMRVLGVTNVGFTNKTYEVWDGWYLINPAHFSVDPHKYRAAQLMKMCQYATLMTNSDSIHTLAKEWKQLL